MKVDLEKLKELAERATPGPWAVDAQDFILAADGNDIAETLHGNYENNAAFMAAVSPEVVLSLIAEIELLSKKLNDSRAKIGSHVTRMKELELDNGRLRASVADYKAYLDGIGRGWN